MSRSPRNGPTHIPIETLAEFDLERFRRDYDQARRPVILKGAIRSWSALSTWTPEYFAEQFRDQVVSTSIGLPDSEVPYLFRDVDHRRKMTVGAFVEVLKTGDRCYLDQADIAAFTGLGAQFDFADLGARDIRVSAVWLGAKTRSGLHYDYLDNFFAQIYGEKRALLVTPTAARCLYPFGDNVTKSQVSPEHPDLVKHPRFKNAVLHEAVVGPGDVLFIPKGWWHYFAAQEVSISLNCWYGFPLSPLHDVRTMMGAGLAEWWQLFRDFFWLGVLGRSYQGRLYSLQPTGKMAYDLLAGAMPWRRKRAKLRP